MKEKPQAFLHLMGLLCIILFLNKLDSGYLLNIRIKVVVKAIYTCFILLKYLVTYRYSMLRQRTDIPSDITRSSSTGQLI